MQQRRTVTTVAIAMQTVELHQGLETGINEGLCAGHLFKLELPVSEESIVTSFATFVKSRKRDG